MKEPVSYECNLGFSDMTHSIMRVIVAKSVMRILTRFSVCQKT